MTGVPPPPTTPATPPPRPPLPPDPVEYDSERSQAARARGLAAPYIPGGRDPEPERGAREDRYYTRLLVFMVVAIIVGGFVLGIIGNIIRTMYGL
jgi:hypothetical protein